MVTTVPVTLKGFLLPYARHFRECGWHVEALTGPNSRGGVLEGEFDRVWDVPWSRTLMAPGNITALPRIRRILANGRFDVVHVHTPIAALLTRIAAASMGRRSPAIVYTAHGFHFIEGGDRVQNLVYALVERAGGVWTDRLVVISVEDARQALARRIVPASRLVHLPGIGIDLSFYAPTTHLQERAAALRGECGVPQDATVYTMVAEFQPGKNHRVAVDAFNKLENGGAHLFFAGTGPLKDEVACQVERLGLRGRVHFLGFMADIRPLVLTSDATLLPSRREGLSRAVLESLTLGVPVVGGNRRGIRELVDDDLGILVEPDDVDGLARALSEVLAFPTHGQLRERCERRLEEYSLDRLLSLHEDLYDDVLAAQRTHRRVRVRGGSA